jgi:hypothetical protein
MPANPANIIRLVEKVRAGGRVDAAEALDLYRLAPTAAGRSGGHPRRRHPEGSSPHHH